MSAVDQALGRLHGKDHQRTVADLLGGVCRSCIGIYANIHRPTDSRTPEDSAQSSRDALAGGHVAFKLAPFDEDTVASCAAGDDPVYHAARLQLAAQCRRSICWNPGSLKAPGTCS